jgi:hypothetical protein
LAIPPLTSPEVPAGAHPAAVLRELRAMREKVGDFQSELVMFGPIFNACTSICHKIDDLAHWLTDNREYFWAKGSGITDAERAYWQRWREIERGEVPWPRD